MPVGSPLSTLQVTVKERVESGAPKRAFFGGLLQPQLRDEMPKGHDPWCPPKTGGESFYTLNLQLDLILRPHVEIGSLRVELPPKGSSINGWCYVTGWALWLMLRQIWTHTHTHSNSLSGRVLAEVFETQLSIWSLLFADHQYCINTVVILIGFLCVRWVLTILLTFFGAERTIYMFWRENLCHTSSLHPDVSSISIFSFHIHNPFIIIEAVRSNTGRYFIISPPKTEYFPPSSIRWT